MTNVPIQNLPLVSTLNGGEYLEISAPVPSLPGTYVSQKATSATIAGIFSKLIPSTIEYVIDGLGVAISTGVKGYLSIPFTGVITSAVLIADQSGTVTVNLWKCTYAQFDGGLTHPVAADSITGGNPPALSSATKNTSNLSGWSLTMSQGDVLAFQIPTLATNITRVTLALGVTRTVLTS